MTSTSNTDTHTTSHELIHEAVAAAARLRPDRHAVRILQGGKLRGYTFSQLAERFRAPARALSEAGLRPGDRIALLAANSPEWPLAYLAISAAGGTAVPLDAGLPATELEKLLRLAKPRLLVISRTLHAALAATVSPWPCWIIEDELCADKPGKPTLVPPAPDPDADPEIASILFTSGTSGRPKGVMLTHANLLFAARQMGRVSEVTADDEMLGALPLHHIYPFVGTFLLTAVTGASSCYVEAVRGDLLMQTMSAARPTMLVAVPRLLEALYRNIVERVAARGRLTRAAFEVMSSVSGAARRGAGVNLGALLFREIREKFGGRLRQIASGGAPLCAEVSAGLVRLGFDVVEGYGLTETCGASTLSCASEWREGRAGKAYPGTELRIEDPDDSLAGEILLAGPTVMRGYFRDAEATTRVLRDGWFRSGDRGRLDRAGYLTILGRLDELIVTPTGKKLSPEDVEGLYRDLPGVKELAVFGMRLGGRQGEQVHAAVVLDNSTQGQLSDEALQEQVQAAIRTRGREAPPHARIRRVHFVAEIPKTTKLTVKRAELRKSLDPTFARAGDAAAASAVATPAARRVAHHLDKLRTKARAQAQVLRRMLANVSAKTDVAEARIRTERQLVTVFREVLRREDINADSRLADLGADSIDVMQINHRIATTFGVEVPAERLFDCPRLTDLAAVIEAPGVAISTPVRPVSREAALPPSFAQEALWFYDQLEPGNPAHHLPFAVRLRGALDAEALRGSLEAIVHRHEALRTTFATVDGKAVQAIHAPAVWPMPTVDLRCVAPAERDSEAQRLMREEARQPFSLCKGPLLRTTLLRLGDDDHILLVTVHHIVFDGWSTGVFVHELGALYGAQVKGELARLSALPVQYADFSAWQRVQLQGDAAARKLAYWKERLAGAPVLELPTDHPRPSERSHRGATRRFELPADLLAQLHRLSHNHDCTLFMTVLTAFEVLLSRYSEQDDFCVGTPIANRSRTEVEGLIGYFINDLCLRAELSDDPSFSEALRRTRHSVLAAFDNSDLPFDQIVESLDLERDRSRTPLFQVMLALQSFPMEDLSMPGLTLQPIELDAGASLFDLMVTLTERPSGLAGTIEYSTDLFDEGTIDRLLMHFRTLLEAVVTAPETRISRLPILSEAAPEVRCQ